VPKVIKPQKGPQEAFLSSSADIVIYGGAAGGGKSYALLMEPMRHKNVRGYNAVIFRTQFTDIVKSGGLWEESEKMYSEVKGSYPRFLDKQWLFRDKKGNVTSKVTFSYLNNQNLGTWKGSQICFIGFDEVCDFTQAQFFFMLSRNRSTCGVTPYIRATCNPDADSWVAEFISWWIDQETGYAIPERSGVIRWFVRRDERIYWADTKEELWEQFNLVTEEDRSEPRSVTFIASSIYDNKELLRVNPQYLGNLKAMAEIERERFLKGNWKIRPSSGLYFKRTQVGEYLAVIPDDVVQWVRCWDLAATSEDEKGDPAYTAGVLIGKRRNGRFIVADVINKRLSANEVRQLIKLTGQQDNAKFKRRVRIRLPQDPGQAGKDQAKQYVKFLAGFDVRTELESGSKEDRATPFAAQWQAGNVDVLIADWNDMYLSQLESFPQGKFKDMVDASSNGFAELVLNNTFNPAVLT